MRPKHTLWVLMVFSCLSLQAQTIWTGTNGINWFDAGNWSAGLPSAGNQPATLPLAPIGGNYPTISAPLNVDFLVDNYGTLTLNANLSNMNTIINQFGANLINNATLTNRVTGFIDNDGNFVNNASLVNRGVIDNSFMFANVMGAQMDNNVAGSSFFNNGSYNNAGTTTNVGFFQNNDIFLNTGRVRNRNNFSNSFGSLFDNGILADNGILENESLFIIGGNFYNNVGSITNTDLLNILSSGMLNSSASIYNAGDINNAGSISNDGQFDNHGTVINDFGSSFANDGQLINHTCDFIYHYTATPLSNAGTLVNNGIIYEIGSAFPPTSGSGVVFNNPGTLPSPNAVCTPVVTVYLDQNNQASITTFDVDGNLSNAPYCGIASKTLSQSQFDCDDVGSNLVTLTVYDSIGFFSSCQTTVNVLDTIRPVITCPSNQSFNLLPFECERQVSFQVTATDNCTNPVTINQIDGTGLGSGDEFPIGTTVLTFVAVDGSGNTDTCSFSITINEYVSASAGLLCNDNGNLSISDACEGRISPQMILLGNYGCIDDFVVTILPNGGDSIDISHVGQLLTVMVTDTQSGNNCWGTLLIEDKRPPFFEACENDTLLCLQNIDPDSLGGEARSPIITDCSPFDYYYFDLTTTNTDCTDTISRIITRTWIATDALGNTNSCTQSIYIRKLSLRNISPVCPPTFEVECNDTIFDPSPANTGYPTAVIDGVTYALTDSTCYLCGLLAGYTDTRLVTCGNSYKIIRQWQIFDWCEPTGPGNPWTCTQIIKVKDTTPPVISPIPGQTYSVTTDDCTANFSLPPVTVTDCSNFQVRILTPVGLLNGNGGPVPPPGLSIGNHTLQYIVTDGCGNVSTMTVNITVQDRRPPVPVCESVTTVSITTDGTARLNAQSLDDGSTDECCLGTFAVKRLELACNNPQDTTFRPYITFCCEDVGKTIMVVLRVYDCAGNYNDCMVSVIVDNKMSPSLICPPNITIECEDDYKDLVITGNVVLDPLFRRPIDGLASGICSNLDISFKDDETLNCSAGQVLRTWKVTDSQGLFTVCTQVITIVNTTPFDADNDVDWPKDIEIFDCQSSLDTSITGKPRYVSDDCDQIVYAFTDETVPGLPGMCRKVIRRWTMIDWCVYNVNNPSLGGIWTYAQTIVVYDSDAPEIDQCQNQVLCNENATCQPLVVDLSIAITDDCTPLNQLQISWVVDAYNDGIPDVGAAYSGTGQNTSNGYPTGSHEICYTVRDHCNNIATCCFLFKIVDCKAPTPICGNGYSTSLMPTGMVMLNARSFDNGGSLDNCTPHQALRFSYSPDVKDTIKIFTCADLGINPVTMWVTDATGNSASCNTFVDIQDNANVCPTLKASITGSVKNEEGQGVSDVTVQINGQTAPDITTGNDGTFLFASLPTGNDYTLTPQRNDDPRNGLTTFDIVLISKHILGVKLLDSPYRIIAADANRSNSVSTLDLVALRKLVLQVEHQFPNNNTSWRFVKKDFQFPDPANPFATAFPEIFNMNNLTHDEPEADFVAIKVGDVNGNAKSNRLLGVDERSAGTVFIHTHNQEVKAGDLVTVTLRLEKNESLIGCQFTLDFDKTTLELVDVSSSDLMTRENLGLTLLDDGAITVSWDNARPQTLSFSQALFSLHFRARSEGMLSEWLSLSSRYTQAEAYGPQGELKDVALSFHNPDNGGITFGNSFALFQNKPNPFDKETVIGFQLPESASAKLTIYDLSGKVLSEVEGDYTKGYNEIRIDERELTGKGVLYYRLDTPEHTATRKMILLKKE